MKKEQIELIIVKVIADNQDAFSAKIYKDGTTCRRGTGALPELGISAMSFFPDSRFFAPLLEKLSPEILEQPLNYEEKCPNGYLEYTVAFHGVSKNGETGEGAQWTETSGIRAKLDHQSQFRDPIMGFLDRFAIDTVQITDEWYFDVMVNVRYKALSSRLPAQTFIAQPKTELEIHMAYASYIDQMMVSAGKWRMPTFADDKLYEIDGRPYTPVIYQDHVAFNIRFIEPSAEPQQTPEVPIASPSQNKKWWKFW